MANHEKHVFNGKGVYKTCQDALTASASQIAQYNVLKEAYEAMDPAERTPVLTFDLEKAKVAAEQWLKGLVSLNCKKFDPKKARMVVLLTVDGVTKPAVISFLNEIPGAIKPSQPEELSRLIEAGVFPPGTKVREGDRAPSVTIMQFRGRIEEGSIPDESQRSEFVATVGLIEKAINTIIERMMANGKKYLEVLSAERRKAADVTPAAVWKAYQETPYGKLVKVTDLLIVSSTEYSTIVKLKGLWLTDKSSPANPESSIRALEVKSTDFHSKIQTKLSNGDELGNGISRTDIVIPNEKTKKTSTGFLRKTGKVFHGTPELKPIPDVTGENVHTLWMKGGKGEPYANFTIDFIYDGGYISFFNSGWSQPAVMDTIIISKTEKAAKSSFTYASLYANQGLTDTPQDTQESQQDSQSVPTRGLERSMSVAVGRTSSVAFAIDDESDGGYTDEGDRLVADSLLSALDGQ